MIIKFAAITFALLLSVTAQSRPIDEVMDSGYITFAVYEDYAPYSWEEEGRVAGIDADIARLLAGILEVELRFLVRGADENVDDDLRNNLWKGDLVFRKAADVMLHVPYDRELDARNEFVALMAPYFLEEMAVVSNTAQMPVVETFGRFLNKPIAVELDTVGDFFLSNAFRGQLLRSIQRGRTFMDVVNLYNNGEVPAALGSRAQMEWIAHQAKDIDSKIAQPPMPGIVRKNWPVGIGVKHDSRDLGYAITGMIDELIANGEIEKVVQQYGVTFVAPE